MNVETLISEMQKGMRPRWLHFWGHTPQKDGSLGKTCFSQWWAGHAFEVEGVQYATAEHFMMAEKARLFGDAETLAEILVAQSPAIAKKLGRKVSGFDDARWLAARWDIVVRGNRAKFSQHAGLREFLLHTGDRILVEASPYDRIWGIGMAATDTNAENPAQWKGLNLLGFALMEVREHLNKAQQT
ncbi:MAG: NADAR family protein [Prosthecobacter sp.]